MPEGEGAEAKQRRKDMDVLKQKLCVTCASSPVLRPHDMAPSMAPTEPQPLRARPQPNPSGRAGERRAVMVCACVSRSAAEVHGQVSCRTAAAVFCVWCQGVG